MFSGKQSYLLLVGGQLRWESDKTGQISIGAIVADLRGYRGYSNLCLSRSYGSLPTVLNLDPQGQQTLLT